MCCLLEAKGIISNKEVFRYGAYLEGKIRFAIVCIIQFTLY